MRIAIDLSHSPRWHVDQDSSRGLPAEYAEFGYLGHLRAILTDSLNADIHPIDEPWESSDLTGFDVVIVPISGAGWQLGTAQEKALLEHVTSGRGALLIGDHPQFPADSGELAVPLLDGVELAESVVTTPHRGTESHLVTHDVVGIPVGSSVTEGVDSVHLLNVRPLRGNTEAITPIVAHESDTLIASATPGLGRVVVVGSADMLYLPFVGRRSNVQLLVNLLSWLATGTATRDKEQSPRSTMTEKLLAARHFSTDPETADASGVCFDAGLYYDLLELLVNDGLPDPQQDESAFLSEAELRFHELPRALRLAVSRFRHRSNDHGVLLLKGLPTDRDLPTTPTNPRQIAQKSTSFSEFWLAMFATALGSPFAYQQEKDGQVVQNMVPTPHNATKLSSESSATLLDFHTEAAFHPYLPDYVLLYCVRPDHERAAKTISASVRMILPHLSLQARAALFEPQFRTGIDYSFGSSNGTKGNGPLLAVLHGNPYDPSLIFDYDLMVGSTPEADQALYELYEAANQVQCGARLDSGDLLIIDNHKAVHGRTEFQARFDGYDRWIQRMCVTRDLNRSARHRRAGGRVVSTGFAL